MTNRMAGSAASYGRACQYLLQAVAEIGERSSFRGLLLRLVQSQLGHGRVSFYGDRRLETAGEEVSRVANSFVWMNGDGQAPKPAGFLDTTMGLVLAGYSAGEFLRTQNTRDDVADFETFA